MTDSRVDEEHRGLEIELESPKRTMAFASDVLKEIYKMWDRVEGPAKIRLEITVTPTEDDNE